ncbi:MAG: hypothetical protein JXM79_10605 [Sedimentisphaerales bacterium]|nr:hypothetical protein [Sedimentisphaerales bacterium]
MSKDSRHLDRRQPKADGAEIRLRTDQITHFVGWRLRLTDLSIKKNFVILPVRQAQGRLHFTRAHGRGRAWTSW